MKKGEFENPSQEIRGLMIKELEEDISSNLFYFPKTIYPNKEKEYKNILKIYFKEKTITELIQEINKNFINRNYLNIKVNSHETLGEGEFNKYYQKAVCQIAIPIKKKIRIVRWKQVSQPKYLPGFIEGTEFNSDNYYRILKGSQFQPLGPNSGLTIEII
ncbi:hypothetical protein M0R72_04245 [Candidatus Pacearchaeota archaeon]|jgi:hypothetical protein|nr:hypothetical protein [Candidatus Pacearchaeota archaeon]